MGVLLLAGVSEVEGAIGVVLAVEPGCTHPSPRRRTWVSLPQDSKAMSVKPATRTPHEISRRT